MKRLICFLFGHIATGRCCSDGVKPKCLWCGRWL